MQSPKKRIYSMYSLSSKGFRCILGNRQRIRFWHDVWNGRRSLKADFPLLFALTRESDTSVGELQLDKAKRHMLVSDGKLMVHFEAVEARFLRASFSAFVDVITVATKTIEEFGSDMKLKRFCNVGIISGIMLGSNGSLGLKNLFWQILVKLRLVRHSSRRIGTKGKKHDGEESHENEEEEPLKEGLEVKPFATPEEIERGKLPLEELLSLPMFKVPMAIQANANNVAYPKLGLDIRQCVITSVRDFAMQASCSEEHCAYAWTFFSSVSKRSTSLDWAMRRDIILGIARGVLYLHQYSGLRIVHRDLKASNVLLRRGDESKDF
ncbi:hypothetical protein Syun_024268 [Stephania yunnanensis]|uniref:Protein kinase domain-containing protein n=1 Tax=Stephania yunnanensis TaxID=152371 RepID=A0AAP0I422_9MAGN